MQVFMGSHFESHLSESADASRNATLEDSMASDPKIYTTGLGQRSTASAALKNDLLMSQ